MSKSSSRVKVSALALACALGCADTPTKPSGNGPVVSGSTTATASDAARSSAERDDAGLPRAPDGTSMGGALRDAGVPTAPSTSSGPRDAGASEGGGARSARGDSQAALPNTADGGAPAALPPDNNYSAMSCPNKPRKQSPAEQLPACDGEIRCGGPAHCVPLERLTPRQIERMPDCGAGKCMPDRLALISPFGFKSCTGELGDGRCIPLCFALATNPLSSLLARGGFGCGKEEVCAPCVNPSDGTPSPACTYDPCSE